MTWVISNNLPLKYDRLNYSDRLITQASIGNLLIQIGRTEGIPAKPISLILKPKASLIRGVPHVTENRSITFL